MASSSKPAAKSAKKTAKKAPKKSSEKTEHDAPEPKLAEDAVYLVDGMAYVFRAYFALPQLTNSKGHPTGAIYGFCQMLLELERRFNPKYLAVVMDSGRTTFRNDIYPEYKANRDEPPEDLVPQFDLIEEVVRAFNIPVLREKGFEADDLIASVAERMRKKRKDVVIVSSDKDLMQLIDQHVLMWDPMKRKAIGEAQVEEKWGVPPEKVVEVQALMGDTSDNIPGVYGVGPKTATKLINDYGDLETVLKSTGELKGKLKERLEEHAEDARISKKLATLIRTADVPDALKDYERKDNHTEQLIELFKKLEFTKLIDSLSQESDYQGLDRSKYVCIDDEKELAKWIKAAKKAGVYAFDFETTSLNELEAEIVGISLSYERGKACYVPVGHNYLGVPKQLKRETVLEAFDELWEDPKLTWIAHNAKYEKRVLRRYDRTLAGKGFDTMIASYVLDPGRNSHGLDALALEFIEHRMISYADVAGRGSKQKNFSEVDVPRATEYGAEDSDATFRLWEIFSRDLDALPVLKELFENVEMPLIDVLAEMEETGVRLDLKLLEKLSREFGKTMQSELEAAHKIAGVEFNVNSPRQLQKILFERLELTPTKKTKTGYSTDQDVLEELAKVHELPQHILRYRGLSKLKSTYIDALPELVDKKTGRVHTSFNQTVAATGRLSSSDPNLQNIPIKTTEGKRIREAFIPEEGWLLGSADYSQVELRILAHAAEDKALIKAFKNDADIHSETAQALFEVKAKDVTEDQRRAAKTINFSVVYGVSAHGLSQSLGISRGEAQDYIDAFYERYSGVKAFFDRVTEEAKRDGYVTTLLGRRRYLPNINAKNFQERSFAERTAINTPIQGTAADLIKKAMIELQDALHEKKMKSRLLIQVHDELVFEVPPAEEAKAKKLIMEKMSGGLDLSVPLKVDFAYGKNWAEIH
ncbi:MAG: DNA polymerase I [Chrysiogenetes bacterium]|nr:DNA polymerase I [Chrysiogenetes bacterium]